MPGMVPNPGMQQQYPPPAPPLRSQMTSHQQQQPQQPQQMQQQQHMGQPVMGGTMAITGQKRPLDAGSYGGFAQGQVRWVCGGLGQAAEGSWVKLHAVEAEEAAVRQQLEGGAGGDRCRDA